MTDILLVQPPIRDFYLTAKRTVPYGLACIASTLEAEGFSVEILDGLATSKSKIIDRPPEMAYLADFYGKPDLSPFGLFHHYRHFGYSFEHIGREAAASGAFLVGISSLFTPYSGEALETARVIKAAAPRCKIVLGGHHPTEMPESVLQCREVDFVLRGEGEASMGLLAKALQAGSDLESIPGIAFIKHNGRLFANPPAFMNDPNRYPLPALHLVKHRHYRRGNGGSAVVTASRGCPLRCSYCSVGGPAHGGYRQRSLDTVLSEIQTAVLDHGARFIDFEDENISLSRSWFLDLLSGIRERCGGIDVELRAMNGLFPPSLDDEVIRWMRVTGFKTLNLSLGTTSPRQLKRFGRPDVRQAFDEALRSAETHGLDAVGYIIVGAPDQDPVDSVADLLYLAERRVLAGVSVYYPSPGSAEFEICSDMGLLPERFSLMRSTALPLSHTTTREESITLLRLGRILNFMKSIALRNHAVKNPAVERIDPELDRTDIGKILLALFLQDGNIRGATPEGDVYDHRISRALTTKFLEGLTG
ncbi:MAG: B12-binding domain-containing radical SAM protein [Acidobacteriota bacterium]